MAPAPQRDECAHGHRRHLPRAGDHSSRRPSSGEEVFEANSAVCHGPGGEGDFGPALTDKTDPQVVEEQVRGGGARMPSFEEQLSDEEIAAVVNYVTETIAGGG